MREPYGEGLASHADPESCATDTKGRQRPEGRGEALTGARAGQVLSREITSLGRRRCLRKRKAISGATLCEPLRSPARSETLCMCGNTSRENREVLRSATADGAGARIGKSEDAIR